MENIKSLLLRNLEDITIVADAQNPNDEHLTLTSEVQYQGDNYYLAAEVIAHKGGDFDKGNYHSDRGDSEGRGVIGKIASATILKISVFKNDDEFNSILFSNSEIENSIGLWN